MKENIGAEQTISLRGEKDPRLTEFEYRQLVASIAEQMRRESKAKPGNKEGEKNEHHS